MYKNNIYKIFSLLITGIFLLLPSLSYAENIDLFAGEVRVLGKVKVDRVAIGKGAVIRAEVLETGELLVIALAEGSSSLHLWNKDGSQTDYNIYVTAKDPEMRVHLQTMVNMKVKIIEFRKSALSKLGIDWTKDIAGPTFATIGDVVSSRLFRPPVDAALGIQNGLPSAIKPFSTHFGLATSITSRINYLASNGDAVTLAEPTLSCVNGGRATFLSGGEIPYPVVGANGQISVEFKEYGIRLDVSPVANKQGDIYTKILTEVSQIDPAVSVAGAPGLLTRRAQTEVNVTEGETIVIAGLLDAQNSKDFDKVAGLGDIPFIGALFRTKDSIDRLTELAIFLTPELQKPRQQKMSKRNTTLLKNSRERLKKVGKKLKYKILE
ncbi:MAG: pilus assembly protein N-terminal domain-containing protein [Methylococcales bacterium]